MALPCQVSLECASLYPHEITTVIPLFNMASEGGADCADETHAGEPWALLMIPRRFWAFLKVCRLAFV